MNFTMNTFSGLTFLLLLLSFSSSDPIPLDDVENICDLSGMPMYCNCDQTYQDEARYVSCYLASNLTQTDHHWSGFKKQRNITSLSFIAREEVTLNYVPQQILRELSMINHLGMAEAKLGVLPQYSFSNMSALRSVDVERNGITGLENRAVAHLPLLVKFTISDNQISELPSEPFYDCPKLEELYMEHNEIHKIHDGAFSQLHHLKELDLFHNHLKHLTPKTLGGLKSLQRLDISRNRLSTLKDHTFRGTPNLRSLDLSHNRLTQVSDHAFDGLRQLGNLRMKDNRLIHLADTIFAGCPNLVSLTITDNHLSTFQNAIMDTLTSRTELQFAIYLKGNSFECRCDMLWVSEYAKRNVNIIFKDELNSLECFMPDMDPMNENQEMTKLASLAKEDLNCEQERPIEHHRKHHRTTSTSTTSTTESPKTVHVAHHNQETPEIESVTSYEPIAHHELNDNEIKALNDQPKNIELPESKEDIEKASHNSHVSVMKNKNKVPNGSISLSATGLQFVLSVLAVVWLL